jgi:flavin reductase (DIM6/NTAB) family NADH-FMN oxidoreductase RutF/DNA-binding GntR family transcriptional regulator
MRAGEAGAGPQRRTQAFDAAVFRQVIGNFMSGVVVLTTVDGGRRYGMTVSAVSSLSLDPPMLLTCLHGRSPTQEAVRSSGRFAVNILGEDQGQLAERFAGSHEDKFAGVDVGTGRTGVPLLSGALATVECRVVEVVSGGTHRVFLAAVEHAEAREGSPLAYFRGRFGRFEMAQDNAAYDRLRKLVLSREAGAGDRLDVQELSERLGLSPTSVYYALTRLVGDGLVARDQERGHVVTPLDAATSDDANDAKLAIELGAADLTVGRLTGDQLAEFRRLAEATVPLVAGGRLADVAAYVEANTRFHGFMISAAGVRSLVEAYERLSLPEVMIRALTAGLPVSPHLADDHLALVDAYEHRDLAAVKQIVVTHNERAKATQRAGIERAGGRY